MENNFEIVCGVRSIKNDTPSTGKSTLCHICLITQQTKTFVLHEKLFILEQAERLHEALTGVRGLSPDRGCNPPCVRKNCIW